MPPKSKLGQNFLIDAQAIEGIVASLGDLSGRTVVEIGPGAGALTDLLVNRAAHVHAVELDKTLADALERRFPANRLTLHREDILNFDFERVLRAESSAEKLLVFGNIPYYITSPILLKLAESQAAIERAALMVQREVADRVTAQPGSRDYGLLSVTVQMYGPVERLFTLPPSAFSPPPEVHSAVFRWKLTPRFEELGVDETGFLAFARSAFAQKRKTLANNLRAAGHEKETIAQALANAELTVNARAEELGLEKLAQVYISLTHSRQLTRDYLTPCLE